MNPANSPSTDTVKARVFRNSGKTGSIKGDIINQFIDAPPTMAPTLSILVDREQ